MSSTTRSGFVYQDVMERMVGRLRSVSVKQIQRIIGSGKETAINARAGLIPKTDAFLAMLHYLGPQAAREVLEMITGPADAGYHLSKLDEIEQTLKEIRHGVEATAQGASASLRSQGRREGLGMGDGASGADSRPGGHAGVPMASPSAPDGGTLALVETRRLDGIPGRDGEALRRHLTALDNVVSLDAARALVKGDNYGRTGLAYKHPGEDWTALVAPENRLWTPSPDPRPITEFAGNVVALRRDLDEAARSTSPVFVSHAGALLRDGNLIPFHSNVVRIPLGKTKCGADAVLTDFVRVRA